MICVRTHVSVTLRNVAVGDVTLECRGVTLAGLGIRNVTCAYGWRWPAGRRRSEIEKP